jgi:FMN-dependent NADH-azoreductase
MSCLWRSSQTKANSDKWLNDIEYVNYLSNGKNNLMTDKKLVILDARSKQLAKNM